MTLIDLTIIFALLIMTLTCIALVGVVVVGMKHIRWEMSEININWFFHSSDVEGHLIEIEKLLETEFRELNQDAGDIKRRQRWSSKRLKRILKDD